jgi:hypothetical protein
MTSPESLRAVAARRVAERRSFQFHLAIYLAVNGVIWGLWLFAIPHNTLGFPWPIFPTLGWGVGVAVHGLSTYWRLSEVSEAVIEARSAKAAGRVSRPGATPPPSARIRWRRCNPSTARVTRRAVDVTAE